MWVDWGKEFYNNLMQKWINDNETLMYFTYNEGKSAVAQSAIKTLKEIIREMDW